MARKRLSMRKIREALRLKAGGLSYRAIARACLIGKETVREYSGRVAEAGLTWPLPEGLSEEELERRIFPHEPVSYRKRRSRTGRMLAGSFARRASPASFCGKSIGRPRPRLSLLAILRTVSALDESFDSFRPQRSIMTIQRRFAPISSRFEPEQVASFAGINKQREEDSDTLSANDFLDLEYCFSGNLVILAGTLIVDFRMPASDCNY
jgi:hypothetical protein